MPEYDHRDRRGRPLRAGHEPLPGRPFDRPRVLERGQVANSWRTQRWDSLRLLTPNWMTRLPGYAYRGTDPDGYLSARQVAAMLDGLRPRVRGAGADRHDGDLGAGSRRRLRRADRSGQLARADGGAGLRGGDGARGAAVGAAGAGRNHFGHPGGLPQPGRSARRRRAGGRRLGQRGPARRRAAPVGTPGHARRRRARPDAAHLPRPGHAVVAGRRPGCWTSATTRWTIWLRARRLPSMQLIGCPGRTVDLNALTSAGVRLAGRLAGIAGGVAQFSGSLPNVCALADLKLGRLLNTIDAWAGSAGERFAPSDRAPPRRWAWTCGPGRSARSSGRRDTGRICPGWTSRSWTARAGSSTTAA